MLNVSRFWVALCFVSLVGCGGDDAAEPPPPETTTGGETEAPPEGSGEPEPSAAVPMGVTPEHGQQYWAVYVAIAAPGDPSLEAAAQPLRERGVVLSVGDAACDQGSDDAVDTVMEGAHAVAVYFTSREDAQRFVSTLSVPPAGVGQVRVMCAD